MRKMITIVFWLLAICPPGFGVSTYMGLQPGLSNRVDAEKVFGNPVQSLSATLFEYKLPSGQGKIYIEYRSKDFVVDRIERKFLKPVSRAALIRSLNLPESAEEKRLNKEGKLEEYFGDVLTLSLNYASAQPDKGVISISYYSMQSFAGLLDKARNPQVQFDPSACRELYFWAQTERDVAKRSKNTVRHQAILEILILSQRGECEKANSLTVTYKERYK